MTEPRRIYLGTVTLDEPGEVLALNISPDADADAIMYGCHRSRKVFCEWLVA